MPDKTDGQVNNSIGAQEMDLWESRQKILVDRAQAAGDSTLFAIDRFGIDKTPFLEENGEPGSMTDHAVRPW